ncbi:conserved Plasmodium protein, unknown function [Plasmodium knowlesi strain H]|uniref:Uncharacterized protein n=3 Tax=Plasmodium knowlesi TaxID=5850 RepID=A0A5K1UWT5_PLAKH|nr:conserved Plasmodium protein, unknown function [Plasmodium knowlesi strain H]OTN68086.1 Uncharacterized protein PKNOH_S04364300 [Plasmodium knowlesi]CAA9987003.1 conserved Plasmodium protein, unknown function [Plasmodium knowlesi strain H]SBO26660.1 conserved Plasmodium protein, unknown function [Plasmodium knowlesi strain H]SBO28208.1 conserved Plasmodium protein, unknown function [Plasmodium knowlesi strain H]VVS76477.1 conserved Plasmodium protein, unknown function [Plasmodium knowlesi s|eukprot:XP_002258248.1 hypothetical protein, conserved in Plasmodium species [Plasmodium knowlesi strain H]
MIKNKGKKKKDVSKSKNPPGALKKKTPPSKKAPTEKKNDKPPTILRWIDLLRNLKLKQLKKNIDDEISNHDINKNINDKLLLFLNDELEEEAIFDQIEELKNGKMSMLVDIHKENMSNLQRQFEQDINKLFLHFEEDREILMGNRKSIIHNINLFYSQIEQSQKTRKTELEKEEFEMMDEIYKNYIAERYISNYKLENFKEKNEARFSSLISQNKKALDEATSSYNSIKEKYERSKSNLSTKEREVHELELKIDSWKLKLENDIKIYEMQIERLRNEKTQLLNHIRAIKMILQKLKHNDKQRLIDITVSSSKCISVLEENICLANKLINTNNLCRRYETEREKIASSSDVTHREGDVGSVDMEQEELTMDMQKKNEDQAQLLENFFKRKNKTILDIIILKKELHALRKKNKEYTKVIDDMENKLNFNKKVKFKESDFIIRSAL